MAKMESLSNPRRVATIQPSSHDSADIREIFLTSSDFRLVESFSIFDVAVCKLPSLQIDLVLLSVPRPDPKAIESIQRLNSLALTLKIIVITQMARIGWMESAMLAGAEAFLYRPITADQCLATMQCAILRAVEDRRKV